MLADGVRSCDVCYTEIKKGENYVVHKLERARYLTLCHRGMWTPKDVQVDICFDCRRMSGDELVN